MERCGGRPRRTRGRRTSRTSLPTRLPAHRPATFAPASCIAAVVAHGRQTGSTSSNTEAAPGRRRTARTRAFWVQTPPTKTATVGGVGPASGLDFRVTRVRMGVPRRPARRVLGHPGRPPSGWCAGGDVDIHLCLDGPDLDRKLAAPTCLAWATERRRRWWRSANSPTVVAEEAFVGATAGAGWQPMDDDDQAWIRGVT